MNFTYNDYRKLIALLRDNGYTFANYHNFTEHNRCVIMRHDVDIFSFILPYSKEIGLNF